MTTMRLWAAGLQQREHGEKSPHMSRVFLVVKPNKIIFLINDTIPQKEDRSYFKMGTIVSSSKTLLICLLPGLDPWNPTRWDIPHVPQVDPEL